ncbi:MAG: hypothetical protein IPP27_13595 [Bacteroidetes bacterium]|nr:hypothetical protein [Bacteroidota bacterium]
MKISDEIMWTQMKALIARQVWKNDGFYPVIQSLDNTLKKALELIDKNKLQLKAKCGIIFQSRCNSFFSTNICWEYKQCSGKN